MKISSELEELMVEQGRNELEAAYVYFGIALAMENIGFCGIAKWMRAQTKEELEHAERFYNYLLSRGSKPELLAIPQVSTEYDSPLHAFQKAIEHEQKITLLIHKLYDKAVELKDYESQNMLNWFINEQIEEESQVQAFLDRLAIAGNDSTALLQIDHEAGKRKED